MDHRSPQLQNPYPAHSPARCVHKFTTNCRVTLLSPCCACADERPHAEYYQITSGRETVSDASRWTSYCSSCRDFWEHQSRLWGIPASESRIPEYPAIQQGASSSIVPEIMDLERQLDELSTTMRSGERVEFAGSRPVLGPSSSGGDSRRVRELYQQMISRSRLDSTAGPSTLRGLSPDLERRLPLPISLAVAASTTMSSSTPPADIDRLRELRERMRIRSRNQDEHGESLRPDLTTSESARRVAFRAQLFADNRGAQQSTQDSAPPTPAPPELAALQRERVRLAVNSDRPQFGEVGNNDSLPSFREIRDQMIAQRHSGGWPARSHRLWRLADSAGELDAELESLHDSASRRYISTPSDSSSALLTFSSPPARPPFVPPLTSFRFQPSWAHDRDYSSLSNAPRRTREHDLERLRAARDAMEQLPNEYRAVINANTRSLDAYADRPPPLEPEELKIDCECKICYGQIADTLLLPCAHLVLCSWCADQIGVKPKNNPARRLGVPRVACPVCRVNVDDRVKVFRG